MSPFESGSSRNDVGAIGCRVFRGLDASVCVESVIQSDEVVAFSFERLSCFEFVSQEWQSHFHMSDIAPFLRFLRV